MKKLTSFLLATALLLTASYPISIEAATLNYCATPRNNFDNMEMNNLKIIYTHDNLSRNVYKVKNVKHTGESLGTVQF